MYIDSDRRLDNVEYIDASGNGILDFAVIDDDRYLTWCGNEDADWTVSDVAKVENIGEDRIRLHPDGKLFTCEIDADGEEFNDGPVRCWVE